MQKNLTQQNLARGSKDMCSYGIAFVPCQPIVFVSRYSAHDSGSRNKVSHCRRQVTICCLCLPRADIWESLWWCCSLLVLWRPLFPVADRSPPPSPPVIAWTFANEPMTKKPAQTGSCHDGGDICDIHPAVPHYQFH